MAIQRTARIVAERTMAAPGRILELSMTEGELGFRGGQYVIVDTGIPRGEGKTFKRPYSIVSSDREQTRFTLAVREITGPGSRYLREVPVGAELRFSGPWGKWTAPEALPPGPLWVWATDTGITAAVGLLRGRALEARRADIELWWSRESPDYFVPESWLRDQLPAGLGGLHLARIPPVHDLARHEHARALARRVTGERRPAAAFLVGDGDALAPACELLRASGVADEAVFLEHFFHKPARKAA